MKYPVICGLFAVLFISSLSVGQTSKTPRPPEGKQRTSPSVQSRADGPAAVPPIVQLQPDQFNRLIEQFKSDAPKPQRVTSLIAVLLPVCAIIITLFIADTQKRINRRQTAVKLHGEFYGVEHFIHVVAPAAQVRIKWRYLEESERKRFRQEVASGWRDDPSNIDRYIPNRSSGENYIATHFQEQGSRKSLTEHQALSSFLHFWSNLAVMIETGLADRKICVSLFADAYRYNRLFIGELREAVSKGRDPKDLPAWIKNTLSLERILYGGAVPIASSDSAASVAQVAEIPQPDNQAHQGADSGPGVVPPCDRDLGAPLRGLLVRGPDIAHDRTEERKAQAVPVPGKELPEVAHPPVRTQRTD